MEEKSAPLRRSHRAASLTAQVLWNIQIQDENSMTLRSNEKRTNTKKDMLSKAAETKQAIPQAAASKSTSKSKLGMFSPQFQAAKNPKGIKPISTDKPTRKRKAVLPTKLVALSCDEDSSDKKRKVATPPCRSHVFPERKPLQLSKDSKTKTKLTAAVAPLIKPRLPPITTSKTLITPVTSLSQQGNPIFLLPVSLQGNNDIEGVQNRNVGGLSLVTLQAPPNFLNCFRLNKAPTNPAGPNGQWVSEASNMMDTHTIPLQFNIKNTENILQTSHQTSTSSKQNPIVSDCLSVQLEPLNLKVGQTSTVSNRSKAATTKSVFTQARFLKPVTVTYPRVMREEKGQVSVGKHGPSGLAKDKSQQITTRLLLRNIAQAKSHQQGSRLNALSRRPSKHLTLSTTGTRKRQSNCPSPDYECSSPDVDDVCRNPRHSCNRRHIKLKNKAAPPPGSLEYHEFVEEQRRLLMDIQRARRAKANAKAKLEAKKRKLKRGNSDGDDQPLASAPAEPFKPQTSESSKHDWKWWGRQYMSLVYCAENGKYVSRKCYSAIRRKDEETGCVDVILVRDCVFLLAGGEDELSYVAKIAALWEHPKSKEMMMSLVWYYRPEHTRDYKGYGASEDEIYASKHQDVLSVACIEQRCKILTYGRFCRLQATIRKDKLWRQSDLRRIVPPLRTPPYRCRPLFHAEDPLDPRDMFYCRHFYDVHSHRVKHKLRLPGSLSQEHSRRGASVT